MTEVFPDDVLIKLVKQGRKVACPVCEKRAMSQVYMPFHHSGIGQHIRNAHPELEPEVIAAGQRAEAKRKADEAAALKEARERPLREHVVTGAFLMEVTSELSSLIGMMEPYYSQGNAADDANALIERIEAMLAARTERQS